MAATGWQRRLAGNRAGGDGWPATGRAVARRQLAGARLEGGLGSDRWNGRAGAGGCSFYPERRVGGQKQRRQGQDHDEAGHDETDAADYRAGRAGEAPGAEDRELGRCGAGQQVGGGDAVFELVGRQPAALFHAELAQQRDVGGRTAESDASEPGPLASDCR